MQQNTDLSKGSIVFEVEPNDFRQDFFIKSFESFEFVFNSILKLLSKHTDLEDYIVLEQKLSELKNLHSDYLLSVKTRTIHRDNTPTQTKSINTITNKNKETLEFLEGEELKRLNQ